MDCSFPIFNSVHISPSPHLTFSPILSGPHLMFKHIRYRFTIPHLNTIQTKAKGQRVNGRYVRDVFSSKDSADADSWMCRCGKKRRDAGTSFTKVVNQVQRKHPNDLKTTLSEWKYSLYTNSNHWDIKQVNSVVNS